MATIRDVLVVDDEPDIRCIAEMCLATLGGFRVRAVGSGEEALEAVRQRRPDVILLDAMMPDMDGLTALARLRDQGTDVPVVFLTALTRRDEVQTFLAAGAAGVIGKPFDPVGLPDELRRIVGVAP